MGMGGGFFIAVALGDSLTFGYRMRDPFATDPRVPYPAQLEAMLRERLRGRSDVSIINAGINGDTTDGMLRRLNRAAATEKPDAIIVWGGINDLGASRAAWEIMENLAKIYDACRVFGSTPIACTIAPTRRTSPKMKQLNDMIRAHTAEKGILLADLYPALADAEGNLRQEYSDDGAHLTPEGYRRVAETILPSITPLAEKMDH
jgi:lysophospholipase L1-like esterase